MGRHVWDVDLAGSTPVTPIIGSIPGIPHEREKPYPGPTKMTCDFYLPDSDTWVEYFGLLGQHRDYDQRVEEKRETARSHGLTLVGITPDHIFPHVSLDKLFEK